MLSDLTIKGKSATMVLASAAHLSAELTYSQKQITNLLLTIVDHPDHAAARALYANLDEDADCTLGDLVLRPHKLVTGGTATAPTVELSFKVRSIAALEKRTGGKSWGNTNVTTWAKAEIRAVNGDPLVQEGLGEREIERKEPEGDHEKPESSHDVLAHVAKQVGAWYYDTGQQVALARPSWLVARPGMPKYEVVWDDWKNHTESLVAAPNYSVDFNARPWEGRETLTLSLIDNADDGPAHKARPGNVLHYSGKAAPADPLWIITEVRIPDHWDQPVTITAWRPVDPPEIVDESASGEGGEGGSAGVPTGPIGQGGWAGEQLKNAAEIVREGQSRNLPQIAYVQAIMCAMQESSLRNLNYGDDIHGVTNPDGTLTTSLGLFQQQQNWGSRSDRLTPSKSAGLFYAVLVTKPYKTATDAASASAVVQSVQASAHPDAYARHFNDAREVVKACIDAGKASNASKGGKRSGPIGKQIDDIFSSIEGRYWDLDGSYGAQCTDGASKFIQELSGIGMIQGHGKHYWRHSSLMPAFTPIPASSNPAKGDVVSWSGEYGAYINRGPNGETYGHVAIYSHTERGQMFFLSQNPTALIVQPLDPSGIQGWMRYTRTE